MTGRSSAGRRIAASVLGVPRAGHGPAEVAARRGLPFGRRVLASVLGVRVGGPTAEVPGAVENPARQSAPAAPTSEPDRAAPGAAGRPLPGAEADGPPEPRARRSAARREPYPWPRTAGVPQHLLSEDRPDYEAVLDDALRSAPHRSEPAAAGPRFGSGQLRAMALDATFVINAAAATEYQHYVRVREEARHPVPALAPGDGNGVATTDSVRPRVAVEAGEGAGSGAVAVAAVLAPVLAGTAAAIFLLVGYVLKIAAGGQSFARALVTTGWYFGALTAAAIVADAIGLLVIALRNGPSGEKPRPVGALPSEVARAREAWRTALLERGILPFLRAALEEGEGEFASSAFASPDFTRPGFTSPDFTSPDFTRPDSTSPDYGAPDPAGQEPPTN
ncbi:hypothetical protein ACFZAR_10010 [Streptomyces sp. NPDC008222]|uniref:hypothetical protein n=1 Tax=Streptomyces sp. NPDC008222 TaxID=3364820 RepID=UPI0036EAC907